MRNNIRNLILVAVCIVVLGGAFLALKLTGNGGTASSAVSSAASIELVSKKSEDVVSMNVVNQKGSYTLIPVQTASAGSSSSAASSGAEPTYTVKELSGCPINTSSTESVVKNGFSLVASKNLGTAGDLEEYGLSDPQATVKVRFRDGSSYDYKIGKTSATDSTAYYMCGLNSNNVYIVSIDQGILEGPDYFISKDILAIQSSSGENSFTKITLSGANYPEPVTLSLQKTALKISAPASYEPDSTALSNLEAGLASLSADSVVAVQPNADALKKYGFDHPTAQVQFTVNGGSYTVTAGAKDGDGYDVMLGGVNVVYKVSASGIEAWALQNLYALRSKTILSPGVETVKALTVTVGGEKNILNVARTKDEKKSTEDKAYYTYKVTGNGGKTLNYETGYKSFYQKLTGVTLLEDAKENPGGSPALTVQYQYFDSPDADTVALYPSGDRRYTVLLNGKVFGIVAQDDYNTVANGIAALESGKTVG